MTPFTPLNPTQSPWTLPAGLRYGRQELPAVGIVGQEHSEPESDSEEDMPKVRPGEGKPNMTNTFNKSRLILFCQSDIESLKAFKSSVGFVWWLLECVCAYGLYTCFMHCLCIWFNKNKPHVIPNSQMHDMILANPCSHPIGCWWFCRAGMDSTGDTTGRDHVIYQFKCDVNLSPIMGRLPTIPPSIVRESLIGV